MGINGHGCRGDVVFRGGQIHDLQAAQLVSREDHELGVHVGNGGGEPHRADLAQSPRIVPRRDGKELFGTMGEAEHGDVVPAKCRSVIEWIIYVVSLISN